MIRFPLRRLPLLAGLLALLCGAAQAAGLTASVDRSSLNLGEIVELSLESSAPTLEGRPDLTPLAAQFEILDTRLLSRQVLADGETQRHDRLVIALQPRLAGRLTIPPLSLGAERSQAIVLQVHEPRPVAADNALAPVFIDASLDQDSVYVQAQAVLTLRVFHSVALYDDSQLSPLEMEDARVEPLGARRTYEQEIDGVRHGVQEVRYAIFPQRSGTLQIPAQLFSATALASQDAAGQPFGPRSGRPLQVRSPALALQVKPRPASYPADAPWLPAHSLSLSETWTPEPQRPQVGDSLTRNLLLRAEGLAGAQLPDLSRPLAHPGLRSYPDQPRLRSRSNAGGLVGSREESIALVPTAAGTIELPALEVVWWNTREERLERTSLPARRIEVQAAPLAEMPVPADMPRGAAQAPSPLWPWQLACMLLLAGNLLTLVLWWRARRQPAVIRAASSGPSPRTLQDDLRRACQSNDPHATRQALDAWARQQPETLAAMAARYVPLSAALDDLNGALYSESGQHWQGEALWQAIGRLPAPSDTALAADGNPLPPLYPR